MTAPHPDLDLARSIRPGLDILANEIVIALKKRSRFHANAEIYAPGLVSGAPDVSLLDYELAQVERVHAGLGRFRYADQEPFSEVDDITPVIDREAPSSPILSMRSGVGPRIIDYYRAWIRAACPAGSDPDTYGETVTADVAALLAIMERVNLGKFVAESKFAEAPHRFEATRGEREGLLALIVKPDREGQVIDLAERLGKHYEVDPAQCAALFRFMIDVTVDVEVDYLRLRLRQTSCTTAGPARGSE